MADKSGGSEMKGMASHHRWAVQVFGAWRAPLPALALFAPGVIAILCAWLVPGLGVVAKIGLFATGIVCFCVTASLVWIDIPGKNDQTAKPMLVLKSGTRLVALVLLAIFLAWELVVFERLVTDKGLISPAAIFSWIESGATAAQWSTAWPAAAVAMVAILGLTVVVVATLLAIRDVSRGEGED